jgi:hypothetical protein
VIPEEPLFFDGLSISPQEEIMNKRTVLGASLRVLATLALALAMAAGAAAQQMMQPLTYWTDYTIRPGKEADFLDLVNKVGAPVRDKLMKDGVVLAWGLEVPMIRGAFGPSTHTIWYAVADWSGIEKVQMGMAGALQKAADDDAKAAEEARKRNRVPEKSTAERIGDILDASKTRDWITRDIVFAVSNALTPAGVLPYTRYTFAQAKPGKAGDYRAAWEKYNKPVYDKLLADGTIAAFGLGVEEAKTTNDFTHFTWVSMTSLGAWDKVRAAFIADRERRSAEEREAIGQTFNSLTDPTASRSLVSRALIFHEASMK